MKNIYVLLVFTFCCQSLMAQLQPQLKINQRKLQELLQKNRSVFVASDSFVLAKPTADTIHYSHSVASGDIYILPQDNMPVFCPKSNLYVSNMPVLKNLEQKVTSLRLDRSKNQVIIGDPKNNSGQMPNAYRGKPLVFERKP